MALLEAKDGKLGEPARLGVGYRRRTRIEAPSEPPVGDHGGGDDHGEQQNGGERRHVAPAPTPAPTLAPAPAMTAAVASSRARL